MNKPFFPPDGQPVVPLVKIDDNEELTHVQTRKAAWVKSALKLRIIRIVFASIFKLTIVELEPEDSKTGCQSIDVVVSNKN